MKDLGFHLLLFVITSAVIVTLSALFSSRSDREAFASLPKRLLTFLLGCGAVAVVMLIFEHTFASGG